MTVDRWQLGVGWDQWERDNPRLRVDETGLAALPLFATSPCRDASKLAGLRDSSVPAMPTVFRVALCPHVAAPPLKSEDD